MFYTERLMLRNFDEQADTPTVLQWRNDIPWNRAISIAATVPHSRDDTKAFLQRLQKNEGGLPSFAVCEKPVGDNRPEALDVNEDIFLKDGRSRYPAIGILVIRAQGGSMNFTRRIAQLGIAFDESHQGKGYGTELLNWACDHVFNVLGLHRFELSLAADNARALKCYEKVGFVVEGRQREAYLENGVWKDEVLMALLEKEWWAKHPRQG